MAKSYVLKIDMTCDNAAFGSTFEERGIEAAAVLRKLAEKPEPFRHTPRELTILRRAHETMMANLRAGRRYDVVKRAWIED